MPKSSKKRREKTADFAKPKLKLGKGKLPPSNAADVASALISAIALPSQSITIEKDDSIPTTKRKLTFDDLVLHIKHHNAGTRRDSILGFRELFEAHPDLLHQSLTSLLHACAKVIGDEDASVRKTLLSFLAWLLPKIPRENLIPHSNLLFLYTASAQTHIFPEIRVDAVRFLDLYLEHFPDILVENWTVGGNSHGGRILEGYLGLLNTSIIFNDPKGSAKATSTLTIALSPTSKVIVMESLSTFIRCALSDRASPSINDELQPSAIATGAWYLTSSFSTLNAFENFHELLCPASQIYPRTSCRSWKAELHPADSEDDFIQKFDFARGPLESYWTFQQLSDVVNVNGSLADGDFVCDGDVSFIARLARAIHPVLISTFLDCAPNAFSPSGLHSEIGLRLVVATAEITRNLYAAILQAPNSDLDTAHENLQTMLGYMAPYFPFQLGGKCDIKMEESLQNLNIIFCELTSLLVLSSNNSSSTRLNKQRTLHTAKTGFSTQTERVSEHVVQLLRGEPGLSSQLRRPLTLGGYIALLPTIWSLLNNSSSGHHRLASEVLGAVTEHAIKTPSKSVVKRATIEFIGRMILLETEHSYNGTFTVDKHPGEIAKLKEWVIHLLKALWELGTGNILCTETILLFLLRLFQRKSCLVDLELIKAVCSRLVPYFNMTHPIKGQLPGPFTKMPTRTVRRLVLDVVAVLTSESDDGLEETITRAVADTGDQSYWNHLMAPRIKVQHS